MEAQQIFVPAPSNWTGNGRVGGEGKYFDTKAAAASAQTRAHTALAVEFLQAIEKHKPDTRVCTPAFSQTSMPLHEVVYDQLATPNGRGDSYMQSFLVLLGIGLKSPDDAIRNVSRALAAQLAMEHAQYHAADMAAEG